MLTGFHLYGSHSPYGHGTTGHHLSAQVQHKALAQTRHREERGADSRPDRMMLSNFMAPLKVSD